MKRINLFTKQNLRVVQFVLLDIITILMIIFFAAGFAADFQYKTIDYTSLMYLSIFIVVLKIIIFIVLKLYRLLLDYVGLSEVFRVTLGVVISNIIVILLVISTSYDTLPWYVILIFTPLEITILSGIRISKRVLISFGLINRPQERKKDIPTLIIGAGDGGKIVLTELKNNPRLSNKPIAFVDDDPEKIRKLLNGLPILGPISQINEFIDQYKIEEVIIAIANLDKNRLKEIINIIAERNVKIKRLPLLFESAESRYRIIDVKIEDLLNRGVINLDNEGLSSFLGSKVVLVTGGGGSIGSELCQQILSWNPKKLIIFDIYENTTYDTQLELMKRIQQEKRNTQLEVLIGSVYNEKRVEQIFLRFKPDIVFHAAAYKHVPLMEDSPNEAVRTNVIGTYNIAKAADKYKVEKMVLVSSDKAVRPTNVMGATKAFCEKIIQYFDSISDTNYSAVRFGNVLGSHGSVVPIFKKQIESGGPITITHPEITRFFMTIPEAVSLILQSAVYSEGGEIFILDMGEPVKIYDLAIKMIRLSGFVPHEDIKIEFIGLRPGEKLYEELLLDASKHIKTSNDKIFVEEKTQIEDVKAIITNLIPQIDVLDNGHMKELIQSIVSAYKIDKRNN